MKVSNCTIELLNETEILYRDIRKATEKGQISVSPLAKQLLQRFNYWVGNQKLREREDLELLGLYLYDLLLPPNSKVRESFELDYDFIISTPGNRLRLTLVFHEKAGELANYPWEFLLMPARSRTNEKPRRESFFLAGQKVELILTRFVPNVEHSLGDPEKELRILLVFSNPDDRDLTDIDTVETRDAITTIKNLEQRESVKVRVVRNPTYEELNAEINQPVAPGEDPFRPHIIHFIGHGDAKLGLALQMPEQERQQRRDERLPKKAAWCNSKTICDLFTEDSPPRLVFLHACEAAKTDTLETFSNLARDLALAKVPAVVAMQYAIKTVDAALFAKVFYEELSNGSDVDEAVAKGRGALGLPASGGTQSWSDRRFGTPVVYLQKNERAIIKVPPKTSARDTSVRVPCPNPKCDLCDRNSLELDQVVCVLCDHEVMMCPGCESKNEHRLMDKTIGRCGRCGYRFAERQAAGITPTSGISTEKAPPPQSAPSQPPLRDASPGSVQPWSEPGSSATLIVPDTGSSN